MGVLVFHAQALRTIAVRSEPVGVQPSSDLSFSGLAQSMAGSPARLGATRTGIRVPVTSSTAPMTSFTE